MIKHEIIGDDMQAVVLTLGSGDEVRAEAGAMTYMTDGIEMDARMQGGLLGGLKRKILAGESFFLTYFRCTRPSARVAFSGPYPGKIIRMPLQNSAVLCQRDSFLCAAGDVNINVEFTKRLGAGFFGGEGFILERLEGTGEAFIHSGGTDRRAWSCRQARSCASTPAASSRSTRRSTTISSSSAGSRPRCSAAKGFSSRR